MWEIKLLHKTTYRKLHTLLSCREYCSSSSLASVKTERNIKVNTGNLSVRSRNLQCCPKVMQTIIDKKGVCSDLSRFIADISAKHLMDTINQRDTCIRAIFAISLRDIILVRLLRNNISQSKQYIVAAKFVVLNNMS